MIGMQAGEVEIFPYQKERNEMTMYFDPSLFVCLNTSLRLHG